jgi:hypothetical protein
MNQYASLNTTGAGIFARLGNIINENTKQTKPPAKGPPPSLKLVSRTIEPTLVPITSQPNRQIILNESSTSSTDGISISDLQTATPLPTKRPNPNSFLLNDGEEEEESDGSSSESETQLLDNRQGAPPPKKKKTKKKKDKGKNKKSKKSNDKEPPTGGDVFQYLDKTMFELADDDPQQRLGLVREQPLTKLNHGMIKLIYITHYKSGMNMKPTLRRKRNLQKMH